MKTLLFVAGIILGLTTAIPRFAEKNIYRDPDSGLVLTFPTGWDAVVSDHPNMPVRIELPRGMGLVMVVRFPGGFVDSHSIKHGLEFMASSGDTYTLLSADKAKINGTLVVYVQYLETSQTGRQILTHQWDFAVNGVYYSIRGSSMGRGQTLLPDGINTCLKNLSFSPDAPTDFPPELNTPDDLDLSPLLALKNSDRIARSRQLERAIINHRPFSELEELLAQGADINYMGDETSGFLSYAIRSDRIDLLKWLLENDIQLFGYPDNGFARFSNIYNNRENYGESDLVPSEEEMNLLRDYYHRDPRSKLEIESHRYHNLTPFGEQ